MSEDYRSNETDPRPLENVLFRCSGGRCSPSSIWYGRECCYPMRGCDPCCPKCEAVVERVKDSDLEGLICEKKNKEQQAAIARGLVAPVASPLAATALGIIAYRAGTVVGDNRYEETDPLHWHWMQGWVEAAMEAKGIKQEPAQ